MHMYKLRICLVEEGCSDCVWRFEFQPFSSVSPSNCEDSGLLYIVLALLPLVTAKDWKLISPRCNGIKGQSLIHAM